MLSLFLSVLSLVATPSTSDTAPETVVMRFLSLTQQEKWEAAAAMLTADAQFGVNDVGGPLNAETVVSLAAINKARCSLVDAVETTDRMEEHPDTRYVETHWTCPSRSDQLEITFFVRRDKLSGFYMG